MFIDIINGHIFRGKIKNKLIQEWLAKLSLGYTEYITHKYEFMVGNNNEISPLYNATFVLS